MKLRTPLTMLSLCAAAVVAQGCVIEEENVVDTVAEDFVDGTSQLAPEGQPDITYPEGATGFTVGKVMPDYVFWGFADFLNPGNTALPSALPGYQQIRAADFYNPDGAGMYPGGSPYIKTAAQVDALKTEFPEHAGLYGSFVPSAKPKALAIIVSSVWCGPCNAEAKNQLPGLYAEMRAKGGHIMSILFDSKDQGVPATLDYDLQNWSNAYKPGYTMVIDPARRVDPIAPPFYPGGVIIDTRTMRIMHIGSLTGSNHAKFWGIYEEVIAGTYQPPS